MSGRYVLDTNIVIALFANDTTVLSSLQSAQAVFVPSIVIGELYYGAQRSARVTHNISRIDDFRAANRVLVCDGTTALVYGEVKNALRQKGKPIPENDIWIAAITLQHDLTIVPETCTLKKPMVCK